jgi:hypothetical protein
MGRGNQPMLIKPHTPLQRRGGSAWTACKPHPGESDGRVGQTGCRTGWLAWLAGLPSYLAHDPWVFASD